MANGVSFLPEGCTFGMHSMTEEVPMIDIDGIPLDLFNGVGFNSVDKPVLTASK
jgi:hypothetical protein